MNLDLGQLIKALSDTVDLVGVDELYHSKRVAYMAAECSKVLGGGQDEQLRLFRQGLLHDCGVSSTKVHDRLVNEFEWQDSEMHCLVGSSRLMKFSPLADYAEVVRYHHTRWEELQQMDINEEEKVDANLIYLLDRVDALSGVAEGENKLSKKEEVCAQIDSFRNSHFKPELVDSFVECAEKEAFWITQENGHLTEYLRLHSPEYEEISLDKKQLGDMATIFAQVVDAKSHYTAEHSFGVSRVAGYLSRQCQLDEEVSAKIEVAGLLHDLGKLQVPDQILEHDGDLDMDSLAIMRHHSYVTYMILSKVGGLEDITVWAADHHEKLDGSGYPFKKVGDELPIESRIIAVADIFQALAQNRPYRKSLAADDIVERLQRDVDNGKLDRELVRIVAADSSSCYRTAVSW